MSPTLSRQEAVHLLKHAPLGELMAQADQLRRQLHPAREVTFVVDTNPNYTNICVTDCTFCSFFRKPNDPSGYVTSPDELAARIEVAHQHGATTALIQGGHHPSLTWDYARGLIEAIQRRTPAIHIHPFSPSEISHFATTSGMTIEAVLADMWALGIRSIPGGGAEILVDRVRRKLAPKKLKSAEWLGVMRAAHRAGFKTSATMTYGHVETPEEIVEHLFELQHLQAETGGFYAFIPWSFKPGRSPLAKLVRSEASPTFYLRVIAIARLVLEGIPHIQASWFGEGVRAGQLALFGGADDFGGVLLEENVLREADHAIATSVESVLDMIQQVGFVPVQRTTLYGRLRDYPATATPLQANVSPDFVRRRGRTIPIHSLTPESLS
jgi:cyclic dehypoxanthinyl futalosine synthase